MESRRRNPRDPDEPTPSDPEPTPGEDQATEPGPLFEAAGEEVEAPEQEHHLTGRDLEDEDLEEPGVVVTHSLPTRYSADPVAAPPTPDRRPEPAPQPPLEASEEESQVTREAAADATSRPDPEPTAPPVAGVAAVGTRFSGDGEWWWNGASWLPAVSHDGLWRWDGARWQLEVASGLEPERLVEGLNQLAEVRYRRRGLLLVEHAGDWPVPPELSRLVEDATDILGQRAVTERRLQELSLPGGGQQRRMGGLLARVSGVDDDPERLRTELENMRGHLEPRLLHIGHEAPVPTFREADEVQETANHLAEAAREVTAANDAVLGAQAEWQARVGATSADLDQRIAERDARISEMEVGVREAEARREHRIADAWRHLAEVRMPGKGEHLASFGPVHLYAARIEMPNSAGPTAAARAVIGSAAELTKAEPGALEDLFLVGDSGAADLHWAESNSDPTPYLLVVTESGSALVTCGENEAEARRFAREVAAAAATAEAMREARRVQLAEARATVEGAENDRSEIEAAAAQRSATEQDPELLQTIERARERIATEREETSEIDQTGTVLQGVLDRLTTAPQPLATVGTG